MGIATGVAIGAAIGSSSSAAAISAAHRAECKVTLANYNAHIATVSQAREYASCVYMIHGDGVPTSKQDMLIIKGVVSSFVLAMVIGTIIYKIRNRGDRYFNTFMDATMMGGFAWVLALTGIYLTIGFLAFLMS